MQGQSQNKRKLILGITGSFGSGKSTVAKMFAGPEVELIDADKIAHSVIKPAGGAYKKIAAYFGEKILDKNEQIDRAKLATMVFTNFKLLKRLNNIIHPKVTRIITKQIRASKSKVIILDVPLLIEAGLKELADKIIVVKTDRDKQIKRAMIKNRSLSRVDILKRIRSQFSQNEKSRFANFIIDNNGTIGETKKQVKEICKKLGLSLAARSKR